MMGSNGGVLSVERTCRQPIALVESGPIGGCIGAGAYARSARVSERDRVRHGRHDGQMRAGRERPVSRSTRSTMRPATSRVSRSSRRSSTSSKWVRAAVRSPGSTRSSGCTSVRRARARTPGPVCYGRGGTEPTVTDANLVLGRINRGTFSRRRIDARRRGSAQRRSGIVSREPLELSDADGLVHMADGIISIATVIMAGAIRRISVEHGRDPREFVLFAYGGGGPLHASALARELAIPTVVDPAGTGHVFRDRNAAGRRAAR